MQQSSRYRCDGLCRGILLNKCLLSNQTRTIVLVPLGPVIQLSGQVTDDGTSAPIAGATVTVNGRYRTTTDASGNYSLTGRLDQRRQQLSRGRLPTGTNIYPIHSGNPAQSFRLRRIERILRGSRGL